MTGSTTEISIVKNMMLSKKYKEIAALLDCSEERVAAIVKELIAGTAIVPYQAKFPSRKKCVKDAERKKEIIRQKKILNDAERGRVERERHKRYDENRRTYQTRKVNYSQLVMVRIDRTTIIYSRPGEEEKTKREFLKQYKRPLDRILLEA